MPIVLLVDWETTGSSFFRFSRDELPEPEAQYCNQQDLQKDWSVSGEKLFEPEASRANKKVTGRSSSSVCKDQLPEAQRANRKV